MSVADVEQPAVEIRSGAGYDVADVDYPKRLVTVIAAPYDRPAEVAYGNRMITEIVSRQAFSGIEKRAGQIKANRDHSWEKPVGKIVALHPSRKEGLVVDVKVSNTPLGEETLALCDDGVLDASVGFGLLRRDDGRVWPDAEQWENSRTVRRLNRLHLDHLAFVPNPAYPAATVLSVRNTPDRPQEPLRGDATPNLDRLAYETLKAQHDALNKRWLRTRGSPARD